MDLGQNIDWGMLADANDYYGKFYDYMELPYMVPRKVSKITAPPHSSFDIDMQDRSLVGSGEQSFLFLIENGIRPLDGGMRQLRFLDMTPMYGITPCFRREHEDELHQKQFMKLELFQAFENPKKFHEINEIQNSVTRMISKAQTFFHQHGVDTIIETTRYGKDIMTPEGIELGSYGTRQTKDFTWNYGTGLALPRFSIAKRKQRES